MTDAVTSTAESPAPIVHRVVSENVSPVAVREIVACPLAFVVVENLRCTVNDMSEIDCGLVVGRSKSKELLAASLRTALLISSIRFQKSVALLPIDFTSAKFWPAFIAISNRYSL